MINRVRGTQDLVQTELLNFFLKKAIAAVEQHNFSYIETPILEHTQLFVHSLGSQTDVVSKEMYLIDQHGDTSEESICLRPEMTASTIRAFFENNIVQRPWKVYSHGPVFRRERPQKGRWRQFSQFNIEMVNTDHIMHDVVLIAMLDQLFIHTLHIDSTVLKLNYLGCSTDRQAHKEALKHFLSSHSATICETCQTRKETNTLRIFDCKNPSCITTYTTAPTLIEHLCAACSNEWHQLTESLTLLSVNFIIDPHLVRGLDYYNRTVFEFTSQELGAQNAFTGGGRYTLGEEVNGKQSVHAVGAAIGIGRILLLLENRIQATDLRHTQKPLYVMVPLSQQQHQLALLLGHELAQDNHNIDFIFDEASVTNLMKKVHKLNAQYAIIIGDQEQQLGTVTLKNMSTGTSETIRHVDLIAKLRSDGHIKSN